MRLVLAIIQSADAAPLLSDLAAIGASATQIEGDAAVGSSGPAAVIVGVDDDQVSRCLGPNPGSGSRAGETDRAATAARRAGGILDPWSGRAGRGWCQRVCPSGQAVRAYRVRLATLSGWR